MIRVYQEKDRSIGYKAGINDSINVDVTKWDKTKYQYPPNRGDQMIVKVLRYGYHINIWGHRTRGLITCCRAGTEDATEAKAYGRIVVVRLLKLPLVSIPYGRANDALFMPVACETTGFGKIVHVRTNKHWKHPANSLYFNLNELEPQTESAVSLLMGYKDS